jgi:alkylation response protein AidB-like acyl-CoA dehydrogenase
MHLDGYGCAGTNAVSYGLACLELEAGDSGFRSFVSVQGSLAGSGITLEYSPLRHANNLESVLTYEGTSEMHLLSIGRALTGETAFR